MLLGGKKTFFAEFYQHVLWIERRGGSFVKCLGIEMRGYGDEELVNRANSFGVPGSIAW